MAEWKKIIVSGSHAHLASVTAANLTNDNILVAGGAGGVENSGITYDGLTLALGSSAINSTGTTSVLTGSFSGSFTGDGTGLTGLTADSVAFTNITGKPTLISSSLQFNDLTTPFTGSFTGSFVGDGTGLTGLATTLTVHGDTGTQDINLTDDDFEIRGTSNEVETAVTKVGTDVKVTVGLPNDVTIGNNLTVTGNLNVQGSTVTIDTSNLAVEDKFILINSGSATSTDESGIIFGGSRGAANNGAALIWNGDYNGSDGRLAIADSVNADSTTAAVSYYVGGVYLGSSGDAETAKADHPGNIRVEGSDIFIYV